VGSNPYHLPQSHRSLRTVLAYFAMPTICKQDALLSPTGPCDAALNFGTYRTL